MNAKTPENRMRGVAWTFDGCAIEFGNEPAKYFSKIGTEHLPPAHQCGAGTRRAGNAMPAQK